MDRRDATQNEQLRVLCVDDEDLVVDVVRGVLANMSIAPVDRDFDAQSALRRLDAGEHYDLLISDLDMPGMDGAALALAGLDVSGWSNSGHAAGVANPLDSIALTHASSSAATVSSFGLSLFARIKSFTPRSSSPFATYACPLR